MAFAINITAGGESGAPIRELWKQYRKFEAAPSMIDLGYPPHVTLAVYDVIAEQQLRDGMRTVFRTFPCIRLRFSRIAVFSEPRLVVWAAPDACEPLFQAHASVHRALGASLCRKHYQPGRWVPHCNLATNVGVDFVDEAKGMAACSIEPFEVIFTGADCAEFYPIRVIDEVPLLGSG